MKVKMEEIIDSMPAMQAFAQHIEKHDWPGTSTGSWRAGKLMRRMTHASKHFEQKKNSLIKSNGTVLAGSEKGVQVQLTSDQSKAVNDELEKLLAEQVELDGCQPIPWTEIEKMKPPVPPTILSDLQPMFITEPVEELAKV